MLSVEKVKERIGKDPVLYISFFLAVVSMFLVTPSSDYLDYIDVRTLAILLCLMSVVAGISATGAFDALACHLLSSTKGITGISAVLVALPFFLSMFITNDVSLITFVPFSIIVLNMAGRRDLIIPVTVLQTVAANLGSMLLPFGNPQNIFIASKYDVGIWDFIITTGPYVLVGALILILMLMRIRGEKFEIDLKEVSNSIDSRRLVIYLVLFVVSISAVVRLVPFEYVLVIVLVCMLAVCPRVFMKIDWGLLLTFVFLFIFTGNLSTLDSVSSFLEGAMADGSVITSAAVSQVISNVPATIMLSNFTSDWSGLLAGVNIGGFGTPIASMASIITLRIYSKEDDADRIAFLKNFLVVNIIMLVLLLATSYVL